MQNLKLFFKALKYKISNTHSSGRIETNWHKSLLIYPFRLFLHPLDTFNDLKYENKASLWIANTLALLFCIVRTISSSSVAYLFKAKEESSSFTVFAVSLIMIVVWTVCNWATCTLFDGEGTMKDVWIATTYSLFPYIIFSSFNTILSYMLTNSEITFYTFFSILGTVWTLLLIFLGVLVMHQYTVSKNILSVLGSILIIACLIFLALLFLSIFQQIYDFITNVFSELIIRNL